MARVNVRELARNTSKVIDEITRRKGAMLVTRDGLPVAAIVPIDAEALDDWLLSQAPDSIDGMRLVRAPSRAGRRATPGRSLPVRRKRGRVE